MVFHPALKVWVAQGAVQLVKPYAQGGMRRDVEHRVRAGQWVLKGRGAKTLRQLSIAFDPWVIVGGVRRELGRYVTGVGFDDVLRGWGDGADR